MMGRGLAGVLGVVLGVGACNYDATSGGSGPPPSPGDGSGTEDGGSATAADDGTTGSQGTGVDTSLPPADETASGPMDSGAMLHPDVVLSDGPSFDFGPTKLGFSAENVFTATNQGDGDATALQVTSMGEGFSLVSDDCGDVLAAGASCELRVGFAPMLFGDHASELRLDFQDAGMAAFVSRPIVGRGVGVTGNLLVNGGGEDGDPLAIPPLGWTASSGPNWSTGWNQVTPMEGGRTISAGWGPPETTQFVLFQSVDVGALTRWGDGAGLRIHYHAFHRGGFQANDDPTDVRLRFDDVAGGQLEDHASSTNSAAEWLESAGDWVAPAGTQGARMVLECQRVTGDYCNGFFDGLEVWAEWQG